MPEINEKLRSWGLRALVRRKGSSGTDLAAELSLNPSTVRARLNGQNPLSEGVPEHDEFVRTVLQKIGATQHELDATIREVGSVSFLGDTPRLPELLPLRTRRPRIIRDTERLYEAPPGPLHSGWSPYGGIIPRSETITDTRGFFDDLDERIEVPHQFTTRGRFACNVSGSTFEPLIQQADVAIFDVDLIAPHGSVVLAVSSASMLSLRRLDLYRSEQPQFPSLGDWDKDRPEEYGWITVAPLVGLWRDRGVRETVWRKRTGLTETDLIDEPGNRPVYR